MPCWMVKSSSPTWSMISVSWPSCRWQKRNSYKPCSPWMRRGQGKALWEMRGWWPIRRSKISKEKRLWVIIKLVHLTKKTTMPCLLHYWKWWSMKDLTSLHIASFALKVTEHVANLNPSPLQSIHIGTIFFIITWQFVFRNKTCGHCPQVCITSYCYRN